MMNIKYDKKIKILFVALIGVGFLFWDQVCFQYVFTSRPQKGICVIVSKSDFIYFRTSANF